MRKSRNKGDTVLVVIFLCAHTFECLKVLVVRHLYLDLYLVFKFKQTLEKSVRALPAKRLFPTANKEDSVDGEGSVLTNVDHVVETLSEPETELSDALQDTTSSCKQ